MEQGAEGEAGSPGDQSGRGHEEVGASGQTPKGPTCQAKALGPRPRRHGKSDEGFKAR